MRSFLKKYFIPHEGNDHKPHILRWATIRFVLVGLVVLEGLFLFQVGFVSKYSFSMADIEASVLAAETNANRIENSLPPLAVNPLLNEAAQMKANDMATNGYFSHTSPNGYTPWDWILKAGYNYSYAGENIAINFVDSDDVVNAWMASPEHRANILDVNYTEMGYGIAQGMYEGQQTIFVDQMFGAPPETAAVAVGSIPQQSATPAPAPQAPAKTAVFPANDSATTSSQSEQVAIAASSSVLGEAIVPYNASQDDTVPLYTSLFDEMLASPLLDADFLFGLVGLLFLLALGLKLFIKRNVRHPGLIFNGAAMVFVVNCSLLVNKYIVFSQLKIM